MYKRIIVPVDGSETSTLGLIEAIKLFKDPMTKLRLIHVADEYIPSAGLYGDTVYLSNIIDVIREGGKNILKTAEALVRENGLSFESEMLEGFGGGLTAHLIVDDAKKWNADLIVIGTHGRRGIKRLIMGSDAEEIVRTSPVPVLLVRKKTEGS